ncbi:Protein CUSTOS [Apodemus speciosus]|uniref:Protein CUSTOS n=1 Tax=Apodemus speciosus TaxID=105296 RepID=A0ABQ0ESM0_APOSI
MVAPSGAMSDSESSSSGGSDAEELARCREAATPAWGLEQRPQGAEKPEAGAADKPAPAPQPSRRREVSQHEEDGNELRTTPEFRAHVAKKLGALLDSSIAIAEVWKKSQKVLQQAAKEGDERGFRLFFTSVTGGQEKEASPKPCRKRQPPAPGEDSDEERQRCREAAVSAADILQASAVHCPAKGEGQAEKKKKLKKKAKKRAGAGLDQVKEAGSISGDPVSLGTQKKKKEEKGQESQRGFPVPTGRVCGRQA